MLNVLVVYLAVGAVVHGAFYAVFRDRSAAYITALRRTGYRTGDIARIILAESAIIILMWPLSAAVLFVIFRFGRD